MATEETIVNKIVSIDTILDIAKYLEDKKAEYEKLFAEEEMKNQGLPLNARRYQYRQTIAPKLEYEIILIDNRSLKQANYNWFISNLENANLIKKISISYSISYENNIDASNKIHKNIHAYIIFTHDNIHLSVQGRETEDETYNLHTTIRNMIYNCEDRYNKTVKNRNIRVQSFCLSIGFVLSYILYLVLICMKSKMPEILNMLLSNKYVVVFGQWFVAAILGNVFGIGIMSRLYRYILPKAKYSHYDRSSHRSVYMDNIEDYVSHNEVQINVFANNGRNRKLIEKIYKVTSKIVLVQLLLSIIYFIVL